MTMTVATRDSDELEDRLQHEIDPELQKELLRYPGKWALITRSKLIAIASSPSDLMKKGEKVEASGVMLYRIPEDSNTAFFF